MSPAQEEKYQTFRRLPGEIQDTISSVASVGINQSIGKTHGLSPEKIAALADEIGLVLLGLSRPFDFTHKLRERLGMSEEQAGKMAREVQGQTFAPIQKSLQELHGLVSWDLGTGPLPLVNTPEPTSIWSTLAQKRGGNVANIFDIMKKYH